MSETAAWEELPDAIRIPLHELLADADWLFGRVAADGASAGMMASALRDKLEAIETAVRSALFEPDVMALLQAALRSAPAAGLHLAITVTEAKQTTTAA